MEDKKYQIYAENETLIKLMVEFVKDSLNFEFVNTRSSGCNYISISCGLTSKELSSALNDMVGEGNFSIYNA